MRNYLGLFLAVWLMFDDFSCYAAVADAPNPAGDCALNDAYVQGLNDGLSPHQMFQSNYAQSVQCTANVDLLNDAYKQGFLAGLPYRARTVNQIQLHYPNAWTVTNAN